MYFVFNFIEQKKFLEPLKKDFFLHGAKRTRTADIFGVNETLYQLSYNPL